MLWELNSTSLSGLMPAAVVLLKRNLTKYFLSALAGLEKYHYIKNIVVLALLSISAFLTLLFMMRKVYGAV